MILHCVVNAEDEQTLCGAGDMAPALDLFTRSWQNWRLQFPDDEACPDCDRAWKETAIEMQRESIALKQQVAHLIGMPVIA